MVQETLKSRRHPDAAAVWISPAASPRRRLEVESEDPALGASRQRANLAKAGVRCRQGGAEAHRLRESLPRRLSQVPRAAANADRLLDLAGHESDLHHVHIGPEASKPGLQIFEPNKLLAIKTPRRVFNPLTHLTAHFSGFRNSRNIVADGNTTHPPPTSGISPTLRTRKTPASSYKPRSTITSMSTTAWRTLMRDLGFFGVYPEDGHDQLNEFFGAWSAYPYLSSGVVPLTSIERLFTLGYTGPKAKFA
ncbi:hypothetical protein FN846DRAFT_902716 [Sphaerosporella brunnea]|uniref:Uncharacterized protein n=1 Tax=Sphaerosporella brunnea TaxID=1250544 RepID=A0A5J5F9M1_9PEZI|nr:hypothetical protein FN846DRAFT_902716 [Sphaerosporella brunnea]